MQTNAAPVNLADVIAQTVGGEGQGFGMRHDGSAPKGNGFLGVLKGSDGKAMSEYSVGFDGRDMPTMVPTLSPEELKHILGGGGTTPAIIKKAFAHGMSRLGQGRSPFAERGESPSDDLATILGVK